MPRTLARCRLTALFISVALVALFTLFTARRADADPAKRGGATAGVLAQEANRPTPGVDAPKVAPKKSVHHATANAKPKPKATAKAGTKPALAKPVSAKPVKAKAVKAKQAAPKPALKHAPAAKAAPKTSARV